MALDNINLLSSSALSPNSDKILLYRSGGLEASTTLLSLTNSALTLSGVYLDTVNQRVGIGTNAPSGTLSVRGADTTYGSASIKIQNSLGTSHFEVRNSGLVSILDGTIELTTAVSSIVTTATTIGAFGSLGARLGIKGSGSTSATSSLLVQNSSATPSTEIFDDGTFRHYRSAFFQNGGTISFASDRISMQGYTSFGIRYRSANLFELYASDPNDMIGMQIGKGLSIYDAGASTSLDNSAKLQINSTTRGFLKPKMTTTQKNAIVTPAAGLEVFDTTLGRPCFFNGTSWITL